MNLTKSDIEAAAHLIYKTMAPTPQHSWPLLNQLLGGKVWVKHENHTPTGAFKIRGGITFIDWLMRTHPQTEGIVTATRGNHGQSQARAATAAGIKAKIFVPEGNCPEKNEAMRAFGGEVITHGKDFDEAKLAACRTAEEEGLYPVPPFHKALVAGVATYAYELFTAVPDLDTVYVPIGCGSGICGTIAARDALGLKTKVVGVVSENAPAAKLSFEAGKIIETDSAKTFADGIAIRVPVQDAFDMYSKGADRIVTVSDDQVAEAIRTYFKTTHNVAEGAGAAALAALMQEGHTTDKPVGVILCGGNIDTKTFCDVLAGKTPKLN